MVIPVLFQSIEMSGPDPSTDVAVHDESVALTA